MSTNPGAVTHPTGMSLRLAAPKNRSLRTATRARLVFLLGSRRVRQPMTMSVQMVAAFFVIVTPASSNIDCHARIGFRFRGALVRRFRLCFRGRIVNPGSLRNLTRASELPEGIPHKQSNCETCDDPREMLDHVSSAFSLWVLVLGTNPTTPWQTRNYLS